MRKSLFLSSALVCAVLFVSAQTINIGPDQYAFRYTINPNFGMFFNATDVQYELRNDIAAGIFAIDAITGQFKTDVKFSPGSDLLVGSNRYAFRFSGNDNYGLFFNATGLAYEFRTFDASPILSVGANSGDLTVAGNITANGGNSGEWNTAFSWGDHATVGYLTTESDADSTNELQDLTSTSTGTNRTINITGGSGTTISIADNDNSSSNELQTITKTGNLVTLSNGGGSFTDEVDDADADPANELQNLSTTASGTNRTVNISGGTGTTFSVADNDNSSSNELQNLSATSSGTNRTVNISGGTGATFSVADNDNSSSNELQNLTFNASTNELSITSGNTVDLSSLNSGTGTEVDPVFTASPSAGITAIDINQWDSAFAFGDHAQQGYLTSENDPEVASNTLQRIPFWNGTSLVDGSMRQVGANIGIGGNPTTNQMLHVHGNLFVNGNIRSDSGSFSGDASLLFNIPASQLTGIVPGGLIPSFFTQDSEVPSLETDPTIMITNPNKIPVSSVSGNNLVESQITHISSGNTGLGVPIPNNKLEVAGTVVIGDGFAGSTGAFGSKSLLVEGFVGVGTNNPTTQLDVNGSADVSSVLTVGSKIGIGVSPLFTLDVAGQIRASGGTSVDWNTAFSWGDHALAGYLSGVSLSTFAVPRWTGSQLEDGAIEDFGSRINVGVASGGSGFNKLNVGGSVVIGSTYNSNLEAAPTNGLLVQGSVGIGTTSPSESLDVVGNAEISGNVSSLTGDFRAAVSNGVINCGGGFLSASINFISDAAVTPAHVQGDEDLYIDDDLELGSVGYKPGGGLWVAPSDLRLKRDINTYTDGLETLMKIQPVRYKYNDILDVFDKDKEHIGVIAQDIRSVAPYMVEEKNFFMKVEEDENGVEHVIDPGVPYLTYDGSALTYMLVNAVKEQQTIIDEQQESLAAKDLRIDKLEQQLDRIVMRIDQLDLDLQHCCMHHRGAAPAHGQSLEEKAHLAQNAPNPYSEQTIIQYYLPEGTGFAQIRILDINGSVIQTFEFLDPGYGQLTVRAGTLSPATYFYELIVDNMRVDRKQMVLQR